MRWDIQESFVKDFTDKMKNAAEKIKKEDTIHLAKGSDYYGALVAMDTKYGYIKSNLEKGLWVSESDKALFAFLQSPASGYIPPSDTRSEDIEIKPAQLASMIKHYMNSALYDSKGSKIARWVDPSNKKENQKEIDRRSAEGLNNFMI
jgi:hypothetical protein